MLRMSKMGRVVVACYARRENRLQGPGSKTWYFGLGGGQPRRGCGSGRSAELTWRAGEELKAEAQEGGVRRIPTGPGGLGNPLAWPGASDSPAPGMECQVCSLSA